MRLVTYDRGGARRLGAWVDGTVVDLPDAVGHPSFPATMEGLVEHTGGTILDAAREALAHPQAFGEFAVPDARLLIPLLPQALRWADPPKDTPLADPVTGLAVLGPGQEVPWPKDGSLDMTVEIACVVRGGGSDLSSREAEDAIFGYTIVADWRRVGPGVRGTGSGPERRRSNGRAKGDSEYVALSLGPCIVTPDDFEVAQAAVNVRIDGRIRSRGNVLGARSAFSDAIRRASREGEMRPGDLFGSGTGPNGRAHWKVHPGALVEVEAERIGVLRATVGGRARAEAHPR
jgi:hypothetical protein